MDTKVAKINETTSPSEDASILVRALDNDFAICCADAWEKYRLCKLFFEPFTWISLSEDNYLIPVFTLEEHKKLYGFACNVLLGGGDAEQGLRVLALLCLCEKSRALALTDEVNPLGPMLFEVIKRFGSQRTAASYICNILNTLISFDKQYRTVFEERAFEGNEHWTVIDFVYNWWVITREETTVFTHALVHLLMIAPTGKLRQRFAEREEIQNFITEGLEQNADIDTPALLLEQNRKKKKKTIIRRRPVLGFADQLLIIGGDDGIVRLWDLDEKVLYKSFNEHSNVAITCVCSNDQGELATGDETGKVIVRDIETGKQVVAIETHHEVCNCVVFCRNGTMLATAGKDRSIKIWKVDSGEMISFLTSHSSEVTCIAFNRRGNLIVSGGLDQHVRVWECKTGLCTGYFTDHTHRITGVAFSPDDDIIASCSLDRTVRLWSHPGRCLKVIRYESANPINLYFKSLDFLLVGLDDGTIALIDMRTLKSATLKRLEPFDVCCFNFDSTVAFIPTSSRKVKTFANETEVCHLELEDRQQEIGEEKKEKKIEVLGIGNRIDKRQFQTERLFTAASSPSGRYMAVVEQTDVCMIKIFDGFEMKCAVDIKAPALVSCVSFFPCSTKIIAGLSTCKLLIADFNHVECYLQCQMFISCVVVSPDAKLIIAGGTDGTVMIWNAITRQLINQFRTQEAKVQAIAFSPIGDILAVSSGKVSVWKITEEEEKCSLAFTIDVDARSLSFSSNGSKLALVDASGMVTIADAPAEIVTFSAQGIANATQVRFYPGSDLKLMVTGTGNLPSTRPVPIYTECSTRSLIVTCASNIPLNVPKPGRVTFCHSSHVFSANSLFSMPVINAREKREAAAALFAYLVTNGENGALYFEKYKSLLKRAIFRFAKHPYVAQKLCVAVKNISINNGEITKRLVEMGILDDIESIIVPSLGYAPILEGALSALMAVTLFCPQSRVLCRKFVPWLGLIYREHRTCWQVMQHWAGCLGNICLDEPTRLAAFAEVIRFDKSLLFIFQMYKTNPFVSGATCAALMALALNPPTRLRLYEEFNNDLLFILKHHRNSMMVQQNGLSALMAFSASGRLHVSIGTKFKDEILFAIENYTTTMSIVEWVAGILATILVSDQVVRLFQETNIAQFVVRGRDLFGARNNNIRNWGGIVLARLNVNFEGGGGGGVVRMGIGRGEGRHL